jgi:hypothetical protein
MDRNQENVVDEFVISRGIDVVSAEKEWSTNYLRTIQIWTLSIHDPPRYVSPQSGQLNTSE